MIKKPLGIVIGGGSAAAVLLTVVVLGQMGFYDNAEILPESQETLTLPSEQQIPVSPEEQPTLQTYRIDTECELIYGLATGQYPNGERLPRIQLDELVKEYPEEFAPWQEILENNETRKQFLNQPMTKEFGNVLIDALMEESSIEPSLKPIASLALDPQGQAKLQQAYQQYNCKPYFDQRTDQ